MKTKFYSEDLFEGLEIIKKISGQLKPLKNKKNKMVYEFLIQNHGTEYSVTDIYTKLRIEQAEASQSLGKFKKLGLVNVRGEGKFRFYSSNPKGLNRIKNLISDLKVLQEKHFEKN